MQRPAPIVAEKSGESWRVQSMGADLVIERSLTGAEPLRDLAPRRTTVTERGFENLFLDSLDRIRIRNAER